MRVTIHAVTVSYQKVTANDVAAPALERLWLELSESIGRKASAGVGLGLM